MLIDFRVKLKRFVKKYKFRIILIAIAWIIIIVINTILGNMDKKVNISTSYKPHISVMSEKEEVPQKTQNSIENLIDEYFGYCNNKEYEKAYNMLSIECKEELYPNIEMYQEYVDYLFYEKRAYSIQNYFNVNKTYLYRVRIFDDIMATGLTGQEGLRYREDKLVIHEKNGNLSLSINSFIGKEELNSSYEDKNLKISVIDRAIFYDSQKYTVRVTNRSDNTIILSDYSVLNEIVLSTGVEEIERNTSIVPITIQPGDTMEYKFEFAKFFDDIATNYKMTFGAVRIYEGIDNPKNTDMPTQKYGFEFNI